MDKTQARKDVNTYSLIFLLLGVLAFFLNLIQMVVFSTIGQSIT